MADKKHNVYKNLALISQLGINVMVPTFLCLFIGIWIGKFIGTWVVIPLLFLGMNEFHNTLLHLFVRPRHLKYRKNIKTLNHL